jgi:hypothetical protein
VPVIRVENFPREGSVEGWLIRPAGDLGMPAILEIPQVIEDALDQFADVFANQPQRRHFAEYWAAK